MSNCVSNPQTAVPPLPTMTEDGVTIFHLPSTSPSAFLTDLSRFSENAAPPPATLSASAAITSDAAAASLLPLPTYAGDSSLTSRHPRLRDQVSETGADCAEGQQRLSEEKCDAAAADSTVGRSAKLCSSSPSSPTLSLMQHGNTSNSNLAIDWSLPSAFRGQKKTGLSCLTDAAHPAYSNLTVSPSSLYPQADNDNDVGASSHRQRFYTGDSVEDLRRSSGNDDHLSHASPGAGSQLRSPSEYVSPAALSYLSRDYSLLETPSTVMPFATPEAPGLLRSSGPMHCVPRQQSTETRSEILSYKSPRSETPPAKMSTAAFPPACTRRSTDPSTPRSATSGSTTASCQSPMLLDEPSPPRELPQDTEDMFFALDMNAQPPPTSYFDSLPTSSRCAALQASLYRPRTHPALTTTNSGGPPLQTEGASHLLQRPAATGQIQLLHTTPRVRAYTAGGGAASHHHRPAIPRLDGVSCGLADSPHGDRAARELDASSRAGGGGLSAGGGGLSAGSVSSGFQSHSANSSTQSSTATTSGEGIRVLNAPSVSQCPERPADSQSDWQTPSRVTASEAKQQHIDSTRTPHDDVVNKILRSRSVIPDFSPPQADPVPL